MNSLIYIKACFPCPDCLLGNDLLRNTFTDTYTNESDSNSDYRPLYNFLNASLTFILDILLHLLLWFEPARCVWFAAGAIGGQGAGRYYRNKSIKKPTAVILLLSLGLKINFFAKILSNKGCLGTQNEVF